MVGEGDHNHPLPTVRRHGGQPYAMVAPCTATGLWGGGGGAGWMDEWSVNLENYVWLTPTRVLCILPTLEKVASTFCFIFQPEMISGFGRGV